MLETGIVPDFIVVDGKEGGTSAAPLEFSDNVGTPRREGLWFVENALVGTGVREQMRLAASGRVLSAFDIVVTMAIGADWCNSARGFMFALGCLQSQQCHTNQCPVGITTQDPLRQRALDIDGKAARVANFHRHTVDALAELTAAAGLAGPSALSPIHVQRRISPTVVQSFAECYDWLSPGQLRDGGAAGEWVQDWARASANSFALV
jgi:glutamate synthase domain-containing protein 2